MAKWLSVVLIVVAFGASVLLYGQLSDPMPTHWNIRGEVDGWSSRPVGAFLLPVMAVGMLLLLRVLPRIDPRRKNYARFAGAYETVIIAAVATIVAIHGAVLAAALGMPVAMERLMPLIVGVLFIVIGNVLPRARSNWFFGIRTPWTLSSERVWTRVHRVGGVAMVFTGFMIAAAAFMPPRVSVVLLVTVPLLLALWAFGYSYLLWRREQGGGPV